MKGKSFKETLAEAVDRDDELVNRAHRLADSEGRISAVEYLKITNKRIGNMQMVLTDILEHLIILEETANANYRT